jgi:Fur family ferric uptake transcriptional regulator
MKENVLAAVERILDGYHKINNHRRTPERYTILRAVYEMEGHFSLEELGEKLSGDYRFPVSRATLYNTLKLFMELRLVVRHRFQGSTVYEACYDNKWHCHQMCTVCGSVSEVRSREVVEAISNLHLKRFRKDGFTLYIYGICSACQGKLTRQKNKELKAAETAKKAAAEAKASTRQAVKKPAKNSAVQSATKEKVKNKDRKKQQ